MRIFRREAPNRILSRQLHVKVLLVVTFHSPALLLARPHRVSSTPRTPATRSAGRAREGETHDTRERRTIRGYTHHTSLRPQTQGRKRADRSHNVNRGATMSTQDLPPVMAFAHARGGVVYRRSGVGPCAGRAWTVAVCVALCVVIVEAVCHHQLRAAIVPSRRHLHLLRAGACEWSQHWAAAWVRQLGCAAKTLCAPLRALSRGRHALAHARAKPSREWVSG